MLAAYLLLYPTSTVRTILPLPFILIPLRAPAWALIIGCFLFPLVSGAASLSPDAGAALGGVVYWRMWEAS